MTDAVNRGVSPARAIGIRPNVAAASPMCHGCNEDGEGSIGRVSTRRAYPWETEGGLWSAGADLSWSSRMLTDSRTRYPIAFRLLRVRFRAS